jgi:cytochrome c-type biogenesis protein CcmH/NrfG
MKIMRAIALASVLGLGLSSAVHAQEGEAPAGQPEDPAASRSATFQAVEGPTTEDVPGAPLLIGAYGAILALLLGYVMWLGRLQSVTMRDVARMRAALDRADRAEKKEP